VGLTAILVGLALHPAPGQDAKPSCVAISYQSSGNASCIFNGPKK
jgi:hypothetical protein